jgi:hypothetical protein
MLRQPDGDNRYGTDRAGANGIRLKVPEPNPAGEGFLLEFELAAPQVVDLAVYDVKGRCVAYLLKGPVEAGWHAVRWEPGSNGKPDVPPGLYFVRLATPYELRTVKVTLLR